MLCNNAGVGSGGSPPARLQNPSSSQPLDPEQLNMIEQFMQELRHVVETGMTRQKVAELIFEAIRKEHFYILTYPEYNPLIQRRMEDILQQRIPILG